MRFVTINIITIYIVAIYIVAICIVAIDNEGKPRKELKKMIKKHMALLVATILLFSAAGVSAENYNTAQKAEVLRSLGVMQGDPDGNLRLGDYVTRGEFTKMAVAISPMRDSVSLSLKVSPFKDVSYTHWASPYIYVAINNGYIRGYSDFTFRPDNSVTYAEATNIALKLLGYTDSDFTAVWPYGQMSKAENLGLTDGISGDYNSPITREGCVILLNNLLDTKTKNSSAKYANLIDCEIKESIIMIATKDEDSSVPAGKVFTTSGTYKISDLVNKKFIGTRGDVLIKNGDEIISFIPTENTKSMKMIVYSAIDNVIIGYVNGTLTQATIPQSTPAYMGTTASTFSAVSSRISMGSVVTVQTDSDGNVEYVCISNGSALKGPAIVKSGAWYQQYSASLNGFSVVRNGNKASTLDLKLNDVCYFAPDLKMIFAYANTKTGIYESAYPNKDIPSSIIVSGVTYQIEGAEAFKALSSTGDISYGDTVTLLLGKDGKVAGVASKTSSDETVYGYLSGSGRKNFTDEQGNLYNSYYIKVVLPTGEESEYLTKKNYESYINNIVRVKFSGGYATISKISGNNTVSGVVDATAYSMDEYKFAPNVSILDISSVKGGDFAVFSKVFLKRLNGVTLNPGDILYYTKNSYGEIDSMILNNVTGDMYFYGVVTEASYEARSYTYDIGGSTYTSPGSFTGISNGEPALFAFEGGKIGTPLDYIVPLHKVSENINVLNLYQIETKNYVYTLSDSVSVYRVKPGTKGFYYMPLQDLVNSADEYRISAYYDSKDKDGGRVRVIIATEK